MSTSGNNYGDIHRYEAASESTVAAVAIVLLAVVEMVFMSVFTFGLLTGWGYDPVGNMYLGFLLAASFVDLAFILLLYRKEFLPDVVIVKKRRRKWEDLYVREEQADGVDSFGDALEQFKQTVYPYYKK